MRRDELEHIIRAAAAIYPLRHPRLADVVDGAIGELSPFHETFRYYAHGVGPSTAILPAGWADRLVKIQNEGTRQYIGYCLDLYDLAASKLAAGREKDATFVEGLLRHRIVSAGQLIERTGLLPLDTERRRRLELQVLALGKAAGQGG